MLKLVCIDPRQVIPTEGEEENRPVKIVYDQVMQITSVVHWVMFQSKSPRRHVSFNSLRNHPTRIFVFPGIDTGALSKRNIHVSISRTSCPTKFDVHSHA